MFCYHHSTTSFPMFNETSNIFIIGKNHFGKSHCSIGTLIKTSYSTHNIFSLKGNLLSLFRSIISNSGNNVKTKMKFFHFNLAPRAGLEPATGALTVPRSTNWAIGESVCKFYFLWIFFNHLLQVFLRKLVKSWNTLTVSLLHITGGHFFIITLGTSKAFVTVTCDETRITFFVTCWSHIRHNILSLELWDYSLIV